MKWNGKTCDLCGIGSRPFIVILIDLPDHKAPPEYAYSEMVLCKKHWKALGIEPAFEHNRELRKCAGIKELQHAMPKS